TLSRQIEEIKPLNPPKVTIYTCGPTVYDYAHVGHWFTYVRMDTLVRTLRASGFKTEWVMNITDVGHLVSDADEGEDKLQDKARSEGRTAWQIAESYTDDFMEGMRQLHMLKPYRMPKATAHIPEQIALIRKLEQKGFTYVIDDGVYYDTGKFPHYADFARLDLDEQQPGARVYHNPQKRHASDFALWKFSPKDAKRDMEWDSPWGKGFPGWHIECSAMSMKYLGETLDIHTGGIDHVPVHHSNEIAQSEAVTGKRFANYWMHSNHVTVNGEKISKSQGNGIRLQDITAKGITPEALRLHMLESHYRSQSRFSWDSLEAAQNRLRDLRAMAALRWQAPEVTHDASTFALLEVPLQLTKVLATDLDTPQALAYLSDISTQLQVVLVERNMVDHFEAMLQGIDDLLGLDLLAEGDITDGQKRLLAERSKARDAKDWARADTARDKLLEQRITVRDTAHGPIWSRL
ncbi:MAG: cysteine--tRNA ligase, partial [Candidatus Saccharimonadales bacterium]